MEKETKTAEEIQSANFVLNRNARKSGGHLTAWQEDWVILSMKEYADQFKSQLTHQQEINAQLKAEMESWKTENFENVDQANKTIDDLKKQNADLVKLIDSVLSLLDCDDLDAARSLILKTHTT